MKKYSTMSGIKEKLMTIIIENVSDGLLKGIEFQGVSTDLANAVTLLLKECANDDSMIAYGEFEREVDDFGNIII